MKQTTEKPETSVVATVFSVILFLLILVVFAIQLSIIVSYFLMMGYGRCVYKVKGSDETACYCDYTTKSQCDAFNGIYNQELGCENDFARDCIDKTLPPREK